MNIEPALYLDLARACHALVNSVLSTEAIVAEGDCHCGLLGAATISHVHVKMA